MKLGFSTLALFMKSLEEMLEIASKDGFQLIEILCEGPYWPRRLLKDKMFPETLESYDVELFLHAPTIDLNPASINQGIREETKKQTMETIDLAHHINATTITTHPGLIHRKDDRIRKMAIEFAKETLKECSIYADDLEVKLSIENMPGKYSYLCNNPIEHEQFIKACECLATVDIGHANTTEDLEKFFKIENIAYHHINDNNGKKDEHLPIGEGTLNLKLLKHVKKGIIELNNYQNVLKSKSRIQKLIKRL